MHLCLQITEILTEIFASYDDNKESIKTLYFLALVCKIFHKPARDALWRFQRSFVTLVKMFPEDVWVEREDPVAALFLSRVPVKSTGSLTRVSVAEPNETLRSSWKKLTTLFFKRPLTPSDWARFQLYAKRMEQLSFELSEMACIGSRELSPSVFRAIESSLDLGHFDRPLLQNLSELTFKQDLGGISLRDVCVFLGPRLKTLHLSIPVIFDGLGTFAEALKAKCPAIENLYISSGYGREEWVNRVVSDIICSLSSLRTVSWDSTCDSQTLKYLSSLPLWSLDVRLPQEFAQGHFLDAFSNILPFLAMCHLHISVALIADAGQFLQATSSSFGLESLSITFDGIVPNPEQLHTVLTVIQRSSFCDALTTFALRDRVPLDEETTLHSLDEHTLSPLLQCRNLEHITINISYGYAAIDNSLLEGMASAWPCLRYLALHSYCHARLWHSKANFQGLIYLSQHCHALQSVSLQFDLSLPATGMDPDQRICCESLTQLSVSHSHVSDPLAVATFLADVFPNLRLHHNFFIRTTTPGPRTIWSDFEDPLREYEQSLEFIEMAKRWKDVDQMLTARRLELSQSLTNTDVRMQSSTIKMSPQEISSAISKSPLTNCDTDPTKMMG